MRAAPIAGGWQMSFAHRDRNRKARALPESAGDLDGAAVQVSQLLDQREPDASALMRAAVLALDPVKSLEEPRQFLPGNSQSGVSHAQLDAAVVGGLAQRNLDLAFEGVLERVRDQIEDDLLPHVAVNEGRLRQWSAIDQVAQAGLVHRRLKRAGEVGGVGGEVDRLVERLNPARLEAREIEQRVDELQEPQTIAIHQVNPSPLDGDHDRAEYCATARPRADSASG